ncbi:MAG: APC family permease [Cyanobacteria bacterium K_DeepCast_35m_m2_023]|nr:APC family permease [Cyanobacteria bacterium K_DeepCast_35m_m2_023]
MAGAVGGTIGAGILRTPGLVAAELGSVEGVAACWLAGGLYAVLGAVCVAELAAALPQAGGWWVYAERAFGRRAGMLTGWTDWVAHCIGLAWVATTTGELALALFPPGSPVLNLPIAWISKAIALGVIGLFSLIQWRGVKAGSVSQELLSLAKALAFAALVVACFALQPTVAGDTLASLAGSDAPGSGAASSPGGLLLPAMLALQAVITTYDGWASPVYFAEEFNDPGRDLPRSLIGGVLAVLLLYLLINAGLLRVLPLPLLAHSTLPAAAAARALVGPAGGLAISAIALVALLGLVNTVVMAAPRIVYGLAHRQLLPPSLAAVNAGGTPTAALLLTSASAAALVLLGSFERLLAMGAVLYVSLPLIGMAALLALRRQEPELPRPFRCWGYPLTPLLIAAGSLAFVVGAVVTDPLSSVAALALAALALPASGRTPAAASAGPPDSPGR